MVNDRYTYDSPQKNTVPKQLLPAWSFGVLLVPLDSVPRAVPLGRRLTEASSESPPEKNGFR